MKNIAIVLLLFVAGCVASEIEKPNAADEIIAEYLKLPHPEKDVRSEAWHLRLKTLSRLQTTPDTAIEAVRVALSKIDNQSQRRELVGIIDSYFQNEESARLFCDLLDDSDDLVRGKAIHGLRRLAGRTDRVGPERRIIRESFDPKVKDLLPYLIKAADDSNELNRVSAMYGLADSRQDAAVKELKKRLKDSSANVRLMAACFLTEYNDASGLDEMKIALKRLQKSENTKDEFYFLLNRGTLIASFDRITGKSFGEIPLSPYLHSSFEGQAESEKQLKYLIKAWSDWWAWKPEKNASQK